LTGKTDRKTRKDKRMLIDSHTHLEMREFESDREDVIRRAQEAGVDYMITVGTNLRDGRKAIAIAGRHKAVYAAVGVHPHDVKGINEKTYDEIRKLASQPKVVAYGEIGLDFFRNRSPQEVQIRCFGEQLELAAELGLPVIIHDRDAHEKTLAMLSGWTGSKGGVIHCFSGDAAMARKCLDMGFYLSISGPITYPKSDNLLEVVRMVPLDRLLVETDAPYLSPQPHRGHRNEPAYVAYTAKKVSEIKSLPFETIASATSGNARAVFGLP
jgi:TatD DNase family protein